MFSRDEKKDKAGASDAFGSAAVDGVSGLADGAGIVASVAGGSVGRAAEKVSKVAGTASKAVDTAKTMAGMASKGVDAAKNIGGSASGALDSAQNIVAGPASKAMKTVQGAASQATGAINSAKNTVGRAAAMAGSATGLSGVADLLGGIKQPSGLQFTLTASGLPEQTLVVVDFSLSEGLSSPFVLHVGLASADPAIAFDAVLDEAATLFIWREGELQRSITGMVSSFEQGDTGFRQTRYSMVIRPDFWRTSLRHNSRIFQQQSIQTIVASLLQENGINDFAFALRNPHPEREFCVQYQESDFHFIQRLTAEEGMFYYFEFANGKNTLIFADDVGSLPPGAVLPYNPTKAAQAKELSINTFKRSAQVRTASVQLKDYTFKNPNWAAEFNEQARELENQRPDYEHFDFPGRFKDEQHGQDFTRYRLEALRNDANLGQGESNDFRLQPGQLFTLTSHPRADLNRKWQLVSIQHHGKQMQALEQESGDQGTVLFNSFSFIPASQSWRPTPLPKPVVDGPQIAMVVGPPGEEIYCDQYGRIRLQFLWDRYGKSNDNSSCWIRVTQPWAGQGWGMLAIPRIGQEVVVDFLHGDPDQPIVTGRTYHANNIPPGTLPGSKTQMAFRSKTHKGEGFNELRFEDEKNSEGLFMHAQKDMTTNVLNDRVTTVVHDHTESVGHDQVISVRNDRHKEVAGNEVTSITKQRRIMVQGSSSLEVTGSIMIQSSAEGIQIGTAGASITLDNAGNITIEGASITLKGNPINLN